MKESESEFRTWRVVHLEVAFFRLHSSLET